MVKYNKKNVGSVVVQVDAFLGLGHEARYMVKKVNTKIVGAWGSQVGVISGSVQIVREV